MHTILVIDDDRQFQQLVRVLLEPRNFKVVTAINAQEGLHLAHSLKPSLILMDIYLPGDGQDGWAATRILKEDPELCAIPIIILTAGATSGDLKKAADCQCEAFFKKPFSVSQLMECIERLLD